MDLFFIKSAKKRCRWVAAEMRHFREACTDVTPIAIDIGLNIKLAMQ
jgi:hypothetical protein